MSRQRLAPPSLPEVSVAICTFNRAGLLRHALESVIRQKTRGATFEIVVIDDGSTDDTCHVAHEFSSRGADLRYIKQANAGIGSARNRAVAECRAPWIAFLDDDEIATEDWLFCLLSAAKEDRADCVGGPCIPKSTGPTELQPVGTIAKLLGQNPAMMEAAKNKSILGYLRHRAARTNVPGGGNVLFRKSLIGEIGAFREITFGEDHEFFRRAQHSGARFSVAPEAKVYHLTPPERLSKDYLYALAKRGGTTQAQITASEAGRGRALYVALLRVSHALGIVLPALLWNALLRKQSHVVSHRCSLHFAQSYAVATLSKTVGVRSSCCEVKRISNVA